MDNGDKLSRSKRKIRSLAPRIETVKYRQKSTMKSTKKSSTMIAETTAKLFILFKSLVLLTLFFAAVTVYRNDELRDLLKHLSINQYQFYVNGRGNYCHERFAYANITKTLEQHVYGQEDARRTIETAFQQHTNLTGIALIGEQGVGKTLTLNILQNEFQWQTNILPFIWTNIHSQQTQVKNLLKLLPKLSTCGENLILIDDIIWKDLTAVDEFHRELIEYQRKQRVKVIIVYAILKANNTKIAEPSVSLENTTFVEYRKFDENDLLQCIDIECKRLNLDLTPNEIEEIRQSVDVHRSGCKTVAAKVSRFYRTHEHTEL